MHIPFLLGGRIANGDLFGGATDLLQPRTEKHRAVDLPFEMRIQPARVVALNRGWPLIRWDTPNSHRLLAGVTAR